MQQQLLPPVGSASSRSISASSPRSVAEVQRIVREAVADNRPLEPVGGGTQFEIGYEPRKPLASVSLGNLSSILEYDPAGYVVVAQAGMTFAALQAALARHGQTLPLEPALPERQTLGGIVATRAQSLMRGGNGAVKDWLVGCKAVVGDGQMVECGAKPANDSLWYDLTKLYCGSWGTLGILTEVAFKVAPLPLAKATLLIALNAQRNSEEALDSLAQAAPALTFAYLLNPRAAADLLGPDAPAAQYLAVGMDGFPEAAAAIIRRAREALAPHALQIIDLPDKVALPLRSALRDLPAHEDAPLSIQCNILPSQVGAFARMLEWTARRYGFAALVIADAQAGILWAHIAPQSSSGEGGESDSAERWMRLYPDLRDKLDRVGGASVMRRIPGCWRAAGFPIWSPALADAAYMHRIKNVFDPHRIFRPGRYFNRL